MAKATSAATGAATKAGGTAAKAGGTAKKAAGSAGSAARDTASAAGSTVGLGDGMDRLKQEALNYLGAQAQHALSSVTDRLSGMAEQVDTGGGSVLLDSAKGLLEGKSPGKAVAGAGAKGLAGKVKEGVKKLTGGGGGGSGQKIINIVEDLDVGVPVRTAYDQWTQYQEFAQFTKGVQSVDIADDTTTNWKAKIWWSNRSWTGTVTEQIPDQRIVWTSDGPKGSTKGVITFHPLGENLTKILVVVEYYPSGFFEKTANIWRAQGRRLRLDLKHFRRFIMMRGEATDGWRGEIRDGEVVVEHEAAVADEEAEADERDETDEEPRDEEPRDEDETEDEAAEEEEGPREENEEELQEEEEPENDEELEPVEDEEEEEEEAETSRR